MPAHDAERVPAGRWQMPAGSPAQTTPAALARDDMPNLPVQYAVSKAWAATTISQDRTVGALG